MIRTINPKQTTNKPYRGFVLKSVFVLGLAIGGFVGHVSGLYVERMAKQEQMIAFGCGQYNAQTGKFEGKQASNLPPAMTQKQVADKLKGLGGVK